MSLRTHGTLGISRLTHHRNRTPVSHYELDTMYNRTPDIRTLHYTLSTPVFALAHLVCDVTKVGAYCAEIN